MNKMPANYEEVMNIAKEKHQNHAKLENLKPIAQTIVECWDKLSNTEKSIIKLGLKDCETFMEKLKDILE